MLRLLSFCALLCASALLAGCPPCAGLTRPLVAACAQPLGEQPEDPFNIDVEFDAVVLDSGTGLPPEACFTTEAGPSLGGAPSVDTPGEGYWLRLRRDDDASEWMAAVWAPEASASIEAGDTVELRYRFLLGGFSPSVGEFRLFSDKNGLQALISEAADESGLVTPSDWSLSRAGRVCNSSDSCGAWAGWNLDVQPGLDADPVKLPFGETRTVGGFRVTHGGLLGEVPSPGPFGCADWFVADARLAILR